MYTLHSQPSLFKAPSLPRTGIPRALSRHHRFKVLKRKPPPTRAQTTGPRPIARHSLPQSPVAWGKCYIFPAQCSALQRPSRAFGARGPRNRVKLPDVIPIVVDFIDSEQPEDVAGGWGALGDRDGGHVFWPALKYVTFNLHWHLRGILSLG